MQLLAWAAEWYYSSPGKETEVVGEESFTSMSDSNKITQI